MAVILACAPAPVPPAPLTQPADEAAVVEGAAGGTEEGLLSLTGLPGIDEIHGLEAKILDARGTGTLGGSPIPPGSSHTLVPGLWMLTDPGSEYEITLKSEFLADGIVRLANQGAFLVEPSEGDESPRFRLFAGHGSFYFPHLNRGTVTIQTPVGPLVTPGAVFTVTVAPDFQVLVTCREGVVFLTGSQNAIAQPGQVLVADRWGRGRTYSMTPNEALVFAERWLKITTEEASAMVAFQLPRRVEMWQGARDSETALFLALWFREARSVLGAMVPDPQTWSSVLTTPLLGQRWKTPPLAPGLLGETP